MKALLFDPSAGASGDMIMGCLLDMGAQADAVQEAVESVGCKLEISREERGHIMATKATVVSDGRYQSLEEAVSIINNACINEAAMENALCTLDILATAESKVHGMQKDKAKFHEIGALDALADIVGCCAALQSLGIERTICLPISVGGGFVQSAHGLLSIPGPATLEILRIHRIPWKGGPCDQELLTPTGAALLATLVDEFLPEAPLMKAEIVGYGAGNRDLILPNVLRAIIAELIPGGKSMHSQDEDHHGDSVVQLETNVDDVTGEVLGHLIELLMQSGALDVSVLPAIMKKGRSGNVIRAIARQQDTELLSKIMVLETGSLGVRIFQSVHRYVAERQLGMVSVEINGKVHRAAIKVSRLEGELLNIKPEYEDCLRIAEETGLPLRSIIKKVEEEGWRAADQ
jgi:pyridinium-3,5-bisthiocarboxylic acid mononucleotide nickel chelatase